MLDDLPSAARRLAAHAQHATGDTREVQSADLVALLPILDAVAAAPSQERVERWARMLCRISGFNPDAKRHGEAAPAPEWTFYEDDARAIMAFADVESASRSSAVE